MTSRYDHPDSVAGRPDGAQAKPAAAAPDERVRTRYDHPDSRRGRDAPPTRTPPAATPEARLARRYDHQDSRAAREERPQENRQVAEGRARAAKRYDHDDSAAGRDEPPGSLTAKVEAPRPSSPPLELKVEGFDATDPTFTEFTAAAAELRLDAKGAERLLALHTKALEAQTVEVEQRMTAWEAELAADPEVAEHAEAARELLERFGDKEAQRVFGETWVGSHPGVVRLLVKLAREINQGEDRS